VSFSCCAYDIHSRSERVSRRRAIVLTQKGGAGRKTT